MFAQHKFMAIYTDNTFSNNNVWLRRKLCEGASLVVPDMQLVPHSKSLARQWDYFCSGTDQRSQASQRSWQGCRGAARCQSFTTSSSQTAQG